jgi:polyisoprenoid-binding protein YceI
MPSPTDLAPGTWNIDGAHSSVGFTVRHMMISKVRGSFTDVSGTVVVPEDRMATKVNVSIATASINTGEEARDGHVRSGDFLDVDNHPTMTFVSTAIAEAKGGYVLHGDLTLKGVTKPVSLDVEFDGTGVDPYGNTKAGFSATGEINRKDFGVEFNVVLETGGFVLSDDIKLNIDVQLAKSS